MSSHCELDLSVGDPASLVPAGTVGTIWGLVSQEFHRPVGAPEERHKSASLSGSRRDILIIEDDPGVALMLERSLAAAGYSVTTTSTGAGGIEEASRCQYALVVLDVRLPDVGGVEVARLLRSMNPLQAFLIVSGFLDAATASQLVEIGARDLLEKPLRNDVILRAVSGLLRRSEASDEGEGAQRLASSHSSGPLSVARRFATVALQACDSPEDLKTLRDWARHVGVSYSSLAELCRLVGVRPRKARDFVRILRAIITAGHHGCNFALLLDVADRRTLTSLLESAGLNGRAPDVPITVPMFLESQRMIPSDNPSLQLLRALLASPSE